jgi:hypothetical protein
VNYFNVPSAGAITRSQAIKAAKGRNIDPETQVGICWQGDHGQAQHLRWGEMTDKERKALHV